MSNVRAHRSRAGGSLRRAAALLAVAVVACSGTSNGSEPEAPRQRPDGATRLAVLPTIDLASGTANLQDIDNTFRWRLAAMGFDVVAPERLDSFLFEHRIRYTGGMALSVLAELREELSVDAVLATTVDLFEDAPPPRIALNARIVSTHDGRIKWADEVTLAGEDRPGLIGSGEIDDIVELSDRAVAKLLATLKKRKLSQDLGPQSEVAVWKHKRGRSEHRPVKVFRAPAFDELRERPTRVAVLPFENSSTHDDAGQIISGLFSTHLSGREQFDVIEPGEVRDKLLLGRVIQTGGLSLPQGDWVREMLDADLAVTGRVTEYVDYGSGTVSQLGFSVWIIDLRRRTVVWSAFSSNQASDGVVFFYVGQMTTARALAGDMVRAAMDVLTYPRPNRR